jgi:hypothetical protein
MVIFESYNLVSEIDVFMHTELCIYQVYEINMIITL